jgi:hypothetical protein
MFNRQLTNITTHTVQSAYGITTNSIQNNSVFIHGVPDCILGAWWTESSARPMCAVWHDYISFSSHVKASSDGSNWDSKKESLLQGAWRWFWPTLLCIKHSPLIGCTERTLPHFKTRKMFYITDTKKVFKHVTVFGHQSWLEDGGQPVFAFEQWNSILV